MPLRNFVIEFPAQRILIDVAAHTSQISLIANNVFVVIALPYAAIKGRPTFVLDARYELTA